MRVPWNGPRREECWSPCSSVRILSHAAGLWDLCLIWHLSKTGQFNPNRASTYVFCKQTCLLPAKSSATRAAGFLCEDEEGRHTVAFWLQDCQWGWGTCFPFGLEENWLVMVGMQAVAWSQQITGLWLCKTSINALNEQFSFSICTLQCYAGTVPPL